MCLLARFIIYINFCDQKQLIGLCIKEPEICGCGNFFISINFCDQKYKNWIK